MTTNQEFCQNEDRTPNSAIGNVTIALLFNFRSPYSFKRNDSRKARTDQTNESFC